MNKFGVLSGHTAVYITDDRPWTSCAAAPDVFTPEECAKIVAYWDEDETSDAQVRRVVGDSKAAPTKDDTIRMGRLQWLDPNEERFAWVLTRLAKAVIQINNTAFGIQIDGMFDKMQLTRYQPGDKYVWHEDVATGMHRRRKLSFTLQLSNPDDFEGGGLEFLTGKVNSPGNDLGALAVFPAFLTHQAIEVTKGTRWVLVGWFSGPEWR